MTEFHFKISEGRKSTYLSPEEIEQARARQGISALAETVALKIERPIMSIEHQVVKRKEHSVT